jgi:hypothetical protein
VYIRLYKYSTFTHDRHCTYNVTLRRFRVTIVTVGNQKVLHSFSVSVALFIQHTKCMCHVLFHLWPVCVYSIFPHYFIKGTKFGKSLLNVKCLLIFSKKNSWNFSHSEKNQLNIITDVHRYFCKVHLIFSDSNEILVILR